MREHVLNEARRWIGTPYRHQGTRLGVGCDCLGLVRGVWRSLYGTEPEAPGPYSPDWAEAGGTDEMTLAARRHFVELDPADARPGDVVLFRWREGRPAKHCGILDEGGRVIHAYEGSCVVSSPLTPGWARRVSSAHRFPE